MYEKNQNYFQKENIMANFNFVVIEGYLVRDAELKYSPNKSIPMVTFTIASYNGNSKSYASYFSVIAWDSVGQRIINDLKKGRKLIVTGSLKQDRWKDKEGKPQNKIMITASKIDIRESGTKPQLKKVS